MNAGYSRPFAAGINPAGALLLDKDEIKTHQFNGNASFEARFLKHFKATANVGLQYYGQAENELTNPYYGDSAGKGQIVKTQVNYLNFTANQIYHGLKVLEEIILKLLLLMNQQIVQPTYHMVLNQKWFVRIIQNGVMLL